MITQDGHFLIVLFGDFYDVLIKCTIIFMITTSYVSFLADDMATEFNRYADQTSRPFS